jgi:C1A family cysteine protease
MVNPITLSVHSYGWKPDTPDQRDQVYHLPFYKKLRLPKSVDLRVNCSPVEDQGALGSCTANAIAGAVEYLQRYHKLPTYNDVSRLFIYYNERSMEGTIGEDSGAMIRDGVKSLVKWGVCTEKMWPYNINVFTKKPLRACYNNATLHKLQQYQRIVTLSDMQACLASGFPFVFGFTVYESFESAAVARFGIVPMPKADEAVLGGHAVLCVGYDSRRKLFIVRNSWGNKWGLAGYCKMPFDYLANPNLADDMWMLRLQAGF